MNEDWDEKQKLDWLCAVLCESEKNEVGGDDWFEIKKSNLTNAGLGIFTKIDLPKGCPILKYPVHYLVKINQGHDAEIAFARKLYIDELGMEEQDAISYQNDLREYQYKITDNIVIVSDPQFVQNKVLCGHLCNDRGYNPHKDYKPSLNNCQARYEDIFSIQDIKAGEELTVPYGKKYWYGAICDIETDFLGTRNDLHKKKYNDNKNAEEKEAEN
jgi:hypothetical protein